MCLAVPGRVVRVRGVVAEVDVGGVVREALLVTEGVREGDAVLVHAGMVIGKLSEEELLGAVRLYAEAMAELLKAEGVPEEEARARARSILESFTK